jgi:hypothetical protein
MMSLASCAFVTLYTLVSLHRIQAEHHNSWRAIRITELVLDYGKWAYCWPVCALALGVWLLRSKPNAAVRFELIIGLTWLFSFAWSTWSLVTWQCQNTPIMMHMELMN